MSFFRRPRAAERKVTRRTRPQVEALEDRFVPSGTPLDLTTPSAVGQAGVAMFSQTEIQPTGCGVIHDFVRIQANGTGIEQGYNSDARPVQFDEKQSPPFDHSLLLSDVPLVNIGGTLYREVLLGINQSSATPLLSLDQLQIFVSASPNLSGYSSGTLAGLSPIYDLAATGQFVKLDARLSHGNGSGDMFLYVPDSSFGPPGSNPYVYLYSRFGDTYAANGGFEQWAVAKQATAGISGFVTDVNSGAGLAGIAIDLVNSQGVTVAVAMTDIHGFYAFTNVAPGTCSLVEDSSTFPPGYIANTSSPGTVNGATDGSSLNAVDINQILLRAGQFGINYDFTLVPFNPA
jgi:hypothetical protein